MKKSFLRRTWNRYSKLGKGRKKKQKWKRPTGRDNKMREKRRGYPKVVSIGYQSPREERNKIQGIVVKKISCEADLNGVKKGDTISLGRMGKKKKISIIQKAKEKGIEVKSVNSDKYLKKNLLKEGKKQEAKK